MADLLLYLTGIPGQLILDTDVTPPVGSTERSLPSHDSRPLGSSRAWLACGLAERLQARSGPVAQNYGCGSFRKQGTLTWYPK